MKLFFLLLALLSGIFSMAQNMSTPYSIYGIGDIEHRNYGYNAGMGHAGIALKTNLSTSGNNPASLAALEKSFLLFDLSAAAKNVSYHGSGIDASNSNNHDFTIKQLSVSTKFNKLWGSSIGFKQFSSVNYQFLNERSIEGTAIKYSSVYSGEGGLHEFFWNNSFSIGKHLSAGITGSFISGSISQTETITENTGSTIESKRNDYYGNARLSYGLIYTGALLKKWNLSIGGKFTLKTSLNFERTLNVTDSISTVVENEFLKYTGFALPQSIGGGISLASSNGVTIAADYQYDNWNALNRSGTNWRLVNASKIAGGVEFASFVNDYKKAVVRKSFQVGGFLNRSYLQIRGQQINEFGITAGITRAFKSGLMFSVAGEGGVRGTTQQNLIKENYAQLNFTISHRDFINSKGRKIKYQ